jgi:hypothetical protein
MLSKPNETIVWRDAEHELPDEGLIVLVFAPGTNDPVWFGGLDGGEWVTVDGQFLEQSVIAWAEMPHGPGKNGETEE